MTHRPTDSPRAAPRLAAEYRWTSAKAHAFLNALAQCGKVAEAARSVGMTRQSAYRLRNRAPKFAEGWPLALAAGKERRRERGQRKVTLRAAQGDTSAAAR